MPCSLAKAATARFCRYRWSSTWLVAIFAAPTASIACFNSGIVKFETPIARQPALPRFEQRRHRFGDRHRASRGGPVDQGQVELLEAQLAQAFFEARDQGLACQVFGPDLGGDENLAARHAAACQGVADFQLVAVDLGGVYVAVTEV